jgi:hypothetical protein
MERLLLYRHSKAKRMTAVAAPKLAITFPSNNETDGMAFEYADQRVAKFRPTFFWPEK